MHACPKLTKWKTNNNFLLVNRVKFQNSQKLKWMQVKLKWVFPLFLFVLIGEGVDTCYIVAITCY